MNRLECQVTSCQHYYNNCCCLPVIQVDGPAARESSQTCCGSFQERQYGGTQNVTGGDYSEESSIECKAEHCVYNNHCHCEAECVCVGCCCGEPSSKSSTECCTFRAR